MDIFYILLIFGLAPLLEVGRVDAGPPRKFNVLNFGAVGDGVADDTQAFSEAWAATCGAPTGSPTMVVPKNKTFFVRPTVFKGPCKFQKIFVRIAGTIVAPDDPSMWKGTDPSFWLKFESVSGLNILGFGGKINGQGQNWWKQSCKYNKKPGCTREAIIGPTAIKFVNCSNLSMRDLHSFDSAKVHMVILKSRRVNLFNLKLVAPGDSPNTDGIHIQDSEHIFIHASHIETGDDCISTGDNVYNILIDSILCGPGHGISIGSLGKGGAEASVENVHVRNSNFYGTTNGVRIKTWQGGKGFAKGIRFEDCNFTNVENPIIIDQYYCNLPKDNCKIEKNGVQISNVTYANLQGTSKTPLAISLKCSESVPCTLMEFDNVNIISSNHRFHTKANCINAHGNTNGYINPTIPCLSRIP